MINMARKVLLAALTWRQLSARGLYYNSSGTQNDGTASLMLHPDGELVWGTYTSPSNLTPSRLAKLPVATGPLYSATPTWHRNISSAIRCFAVQKLDYDNSGNIYAIGDGYNTSTISWAHLMKFNSAGVLQWQRRVVDANGSGVGALVVDRATGDVYFSQQNNTTNVATIVKYNTSGTIQWQRKVTVTSGLVNLSLAFIDGSSNINFLGYIYDGGLSISLQKGFQIKYNSSGVLQSQLKWQLNGTNAMLSVWARDSTTGDLFACGYRTSGTQNATITKFNSSLVHQWTWMHPTTNSSAAAPPVVDPTDGSLYVAITNSTNQLWKFDSTGAVVWRRTYESTAGTKFAPAGLTIVGENLVFGGVTSRTGAGTDAFLVQVPKLTGGDVGSYGGGALVIADPGAATWTSLAAATSAAGTAVDAAGTLTDSAGVFTDAVEASVVLTPY